MLGSIAAVLYRSTLTADLAGAPDPTMVSAAGESLGSAMTIAEQSNSPELAAAAADAFTGALRDTSLVGGLILMAVAGLVWMITPRGTDITQQRR